MIMNRAVCVGQCRQVPKRSKIDIAMYPYSHEEMDAVRHTMSDCQKWQRPNKWHLAFRIIKQFENFLFSHVPSPKFSVSTSANISSPSDKIFLTPSLHKDA